MKNVKLCLCLAGLVAAIRLPAGEQSGFTEAETAAIDAFLQQNFRTSKTGMVVALIDERRSKFLAAGKLDNGTEREVNGDTLFEISSVTGTFTALLALDLAARGKIKLDDPLRKYLPSSVKVPARGGKEITLRHLAAQDSGLPYDLDDPASETHLSYKSYTIEKVYAFLPGCQPMFDAGEKAQYSNLGLCLLGQILEQKGGAKFESQLVSRICRPLHMDSTCITLTPSLRARLAIGHDKDGDRTERARSPVLLPAIGLYSTGNDLAKFVSAHLGLTPWELRPLAAKMQEIRHQDPLSGRMAMPWCDSGVYQPPGMDLLASATLGSTSAFIGFDRKQRRGVVVLASQIAELARTTAIGWRILQRAPLEGRALATLMPLREIVGVGITVEPDPRTGVLEIKWISPGTPAAEAGVTAGMVIRSVDGVDVTGKSLAECLELIRGPTDTKVTLGLATTEQDGTKTFELTRKKLLVGN